MLTTIIEQVSDKICHRIIMHTYNAIKSLMLWINGNYRMNEFNNVKIK